MEKFELPPFYVLLLFVCLFWSLRNIKVFFFFVCFEQTTACPTPVPRIFIKISHLAYTPETKEEKQRSKQLHHPFSFFEETKTCKAKIHSTAIAEFSRSSWRSLGPLCSHCASSTELRALLSPQRPLKFAFRAACGTLFGDHGRTYSPHFQEALWSAGGQDGDCSDETFPIIILFVWPCGPWLVIGPFPFFFLWCVDSSKNFT